MLYYGCRVSDTGQGPTLTNPSGPAGHAETPPVLPTVFAAVLGGVQDLVRRQAARTGTGHAATVEIATAAAWVVGLRLVLAVSSRLPHNSRVGTFFLSGANGDKTFHSPSERS